MGMKSIHELPHLNPPISFYIGVKQRGHFWQIQTGFHNIQQYQDISRPQEGRNSLIPRHDSPPQKGFWWFEWSGKSQSRVLTAKKHIYIYKYIYIYIITQKTVRLVPNSVRKAIANHPHFYDNMSMFFSLKTWALLYQHQLIQLINIHPGEWSATKALQIRCQRVAPELPEGPEKHGLGIQGFGLWTCAGIICRWYTVYMLACYYIIHFILYDIRPVR